MSRLYGRTADIYNISNYLIENYKKRYAMDNTRINRLDLESALGAILRYLSEDSIRYIDNQEMVISYNPFITQTVYNGYGDDKNIIIFPSKKMKEEFKRELVYYAGDLLRRKSFDHMASISSTSGQYSGVIPLLLEYLYLRDSGKEDRFSDKHLTDLKMNAKLYKRIYEEYKKNEKKEDIEEFLSNSLLHLIPLSSFDATLQIKDTVAQDEKEVRRLIDELIRNENNNREEILRERDIDTYGFKRLRKEIDMKR